MISGGLSRVLVGSERIPTVPLHFRQYQAFYSLTQGFPVRFSSQFTLNRPVPPWFVLFHGDFSWLWPTEGRRASFVTYGGWTGQFIFCGLVRAVVALVLRSFPMKSQKTRKNDKENAGKLEPLPRNPRRTCFRTCLRLVVL